jgi:acyl-CoA thioesterase FadM
MEGYHFSVDVRVRFSETDAQGIANNAVYLNWFDDELRIHTRVTHLRGARFRFEYVMERLDEPQTKIAEGWTGHACVDATTLRPTRMPAWLAEGVAEAERG